MSNVVALISRDPCEELARYLQAVGFDVQCFRAPRSAPRKGTLVWLPEAERDAASILAALRRWFGTTTKLRAILITRQPARLRACLGSLHQRVRMLPAPLFGWQLVDTLREPRFAFS